MNAAYFARNRARFYEKMEPGSLLVEEWGIGFRLEDNCLVTETGCENLSRDIPRTVYDLEAVMRKK